MEFTEKDLKIEGNEREGEGRRIKSKRREKEEEKETWGEGGFTFYVTKGVPKVFIVFAERV